jgi:hypothetical protein
MKRMLLYSNHTSLEICFYDAGPWPKLSRKKFFMRSIFSWFILDLLVPNKRGTYKKLTEGLSQEAYDVIKEYWVDGGIWVWLCSTIKTEKSKKAYVYGAVFILDIIPTEQYKKEYPIEKLHKSFYKESEPFPWQAIIPAHRSARLMLQEKIMLHKAKSDMKNQKAEQRIFGIWEPRIDAEETLFCLKTAQFL